ncbi:MAG: hypothetical protein QXY24_02080 [Candidatus Aenigmatarchaeota archaeon]
MKGSVKLLVVRPDVVLLPHPADRYRLHRAVSPHLLGSDLSC